MKIVNAWGLVLLVFWITVSSSAKEVNVADFAARLETLEKLCEKQQEKIRQQGAQLESQKAQIEQLKEAENDIKQQEKMIEKLSTEITSMRLSASDANTGLMKNRRFVIDSSETVAFHATLKGGRAIEHLHINQTVIFDDVMLNLGGAYQPQQGLFVATVGGLYIFSVSIMGYTGGTDSTMVFIMKNGKEVAAAIADSRATPHDQGSVTVVMQLVIGDEVWVSVQRHDNTAIWTDSLDSFIGVLVAYI